MDDIFLAEISFVGNWGLSMGTCTIKCILLLLYIKFGILSLQETKGFVKFQIMLILSRKVKLLYGSCWICNSFLCIFCFHSSNVVCCGLVEEIGQEIVFVLPGKFRTSILCILGQICAIIDSALHPVILIWICTP